MIVKNLLFFCLIIISATVTAAYSMQQEISILDADTSIVSTAKYFAIHTKKSCKMYTISKFAPRPSCRKEHPQALKEQLSDNTYVLMYYDESWDPIAMVPIIDDSVVGANLHIYAQKRLDPDCKPKATKGVIASASLNGRVDGQICFFDAQDKEILHLPYNGTKEISTQDREKFCQYLIFEEGFKTTYIGINVNIPNNSEEDEGCCILF